MARGGERPFLHFEIIINILERLPVKSILRFRSVCKDWNNLFKTQSFIAEHARHSAHESPFLPFHPYNYSYKRPYNRPSLRLLNQQMETAEVLSLPWKLSFNNGWRIIGSCNGLLCVQDFRFGLLCLWNPVTREVREIPPITNNHRCLFISGFGFSSIVNDYKMVAFSYLQKNMEGLNYDVCLVHVYSLSTDSWKELEFGAVRKKEIIKETVSVDGTMAWTWIGYDNSFDVLVTFDIVTEVFTSTPIPSAVRVTTLGAYQNKFVLSGHHRESHFMDIWVIEQVASDSGKHFSCSEKYRVEMPWYVSNILCIWGNEIVCCEKERTGLGDKWKFHLKLFNLTTKKWKDFLSISSSHECCDGVSYGGSLVSLFNPQVQ
ncbi:hypothetical protein QN277_005693 [Acacia crassicarpa]|uniref:F-box domain-containing protein n=1 Tax=Acacia crassicarpa TaxID=499986 RepID=A0AAE1IYJ2_9FABA|nr:hypothetical protein QN277_005693 [Acacia crassicarpa]